MGANVEKSKYSREEFDEFKSLLRKETAILRDWLNSESKSQTNDYVLGLELEAWIVDHNAIPSPDNKRILELVGDPLLVAELAKYNLEFNAPPAKMEGACFSKLQDDLENLWRKVQDKVQGMDRRLLMIGTLPTLRDDMLTMAYMSDMERYRAINERVFELKNSEPMKLKISGLDELDISHTDIMLESATTSFQIHLQSPHHETPATFNASIAASFAIVAAGANSPYLYGKDLWHESRIPTFEQALDVARFRNKEGNMQARVTFGDGYVKENLGELFEENLDCYEVLLPNCFDKDPNWLSHLRLHNGNIWRWNRPIVGMNSNLSPSLRVEQRVLPAGPTTVDMIANMAFYTGLCLEFSKIDNMTEILPFEDMRDNFYACAKHGLDAKVTWKGRKNIDVQTLILEELISVSRTGLQKFGIDQNDIEFYLNNIMTNRIRSGQNGAKWQRSWIQLNGHHFQGLVDAYFHLQEKGLPVHEWRI